MKQLDVPVLDKTQTFNVTDIWQRTNNIGYTLHTNLTDGTQRIVRWGHLEWLGAFGSLLFFGLATAVGLHILKVF